MRLRFFCTPMLLLLCTSLIAQRRVPTPTPTAPPTDSAKTRNSSGSVTPASKTAAPKPYKEVITSKAVSSVGMFTVHKLDDRYFLEISDKMMGREILTVARISKAAVGVRSGISGYAGDDINENVLSFDKGPNNKLFLKQVSFLETGSDSTSGMYWNVHNSNIQPISYVFDIKAFSPDSSAVVIDITDWITGDSELLFFDPRGKRSLGIGGLQPDKSYPITVKSFPTNIEISTFKTYSRSASSGLGTGASPSFASGQGNASFEINSSLVLLPEKPMQARYFDDRVGYFTTGTITDFDLNPQGVEKYRFIKRFRLEPKPEDLEKYKRGDLVEPAKPIIYYIDPTTPKKWVPYLIKGINDWQVAFEKAGFKNAIMGKEAPTWQEDSTWSLQDARHNAIVYKPSEVSNASGPSIIDPRSGEIIESHVNWYHNITQLLRNWYLVQTAAGNAEAQKMNLDDAVMGELIRFVSAHELGHTLGLRHNFGSSSTVPVEKLRDKAFVRANGHTPSIMDYARFNYVAQPEDGLSGSDYFPRVGDYDQWAIEWGYRLFPQFKNAEAEKEHLNKWIIAQLKNPRLWWGDGEGNRDDPRNLTEDLSDNAMVASSYGVKNLQKIMVKLPEWSKESNKNYAGLAELYNQVTGQFGRYIGHVSNQIGGIERTPKRQEQTGVVFSFTSKSKQQEALNWLQNQVFQTPNWVINPTVQSLAGIEPMPTISSLQNRALTTLISAGTIERLLQTEAVKGNEAFSASSMLSQLQNSIFAEITTRKPVDIYRRSLQKLLVEKLTGLLQPQSGGFVITIGGGGGFSGTHGLSSTSDATSIVKAQLRALSNKIKTALTGYTDTVTKDHLLDVRDRIETALDPK